MRLDIFYPVSPKGEDVITKIIITIVVIFVDVFIFLFSCDYDSHNRKNILEICKDAFHNALFLIITLSIMTIPVMILYYVWG